MTAKITRVPGIERAFDNVFPVPVKSTRSPTSSDIKFPLGQLWIRTDTAQVYILAQMASGSATWTLSSPGASDVDTLTGDGGGAISPAGGNITLAGGTNITTAGAGSTITYNLDDAIVLATSASSPLYTVAAGNDLAIESAANQDIIMKMGDAGGTNKVSFTDSGDVEVAAIDSDGAFSVGDLTFTGLFTASASATIETAGTALNLASDNDAAAVNLGVGTTARAIGIGNSAAAHTVTIGSTTGAASLDLQYGTGDFTIDGAATGDITIGAAMTSGVLTIGGTSQTGNFVLGPSDGAMTATLANGNGAKTINIGNGVTGNTISIGNGINTSAQTVNISSGAAAADSTVSILNGNASAGTITLNLANGNRATAINIGNGTGGNTLLIANGVNGAAQTVSISNGASGADQTVNILSGNAAAGTQTLNLGLGTGGKAINVGTGAATNELTIGSTNSASFLVLNSGTGDTTLTSTGDTIIDTAGVLELNSSAGVIGIGNDAVAQNINIGTGAAARTITIGNTTGASGLVLQSGTGEITVTGTVKEIDAEFIYSNGTDLVVTQSPILQSNATTGVAPTGSNGDVNLMYLQDGALMEQFIIGTQTIIAPRMTANGLDIALDNTNAEGAEYNFGARSNAKHVYTIGTDAAFFAEATFYVEDLSGCSPLMMGFRIVSANNAVIGNYTDYAAIGLNTTTSTTNAVILSELNAGGQTATDTTDAWGGDTSAQSVGVFVSAAGVVTFTVGGVAASTAPAFTFDGTDEVMFFIHFLNGADVAGEVSLVDLKIGYQA